MQTDAQRENRQTIGVLYGFRALMVLFVCNYHFWQQGWLGQYVVLFGYVVDFDFWTRSSYLFVDGMILLSGFLLYLPYARQTAYGTPAPGVRRFYWNRLCRIVPSYLFSVLAVLLLVALPGGYYRDAAACNLDVITHLTFTFTFFPETYLFTPLNGVLWTVAVEMQFYLIFPLLVKAMCKKPAFTLCGMALLGVLFRLLISRVTGDLAIWVNQLPAYMDVYALGMAGAILFVRLQRWLEEAPEGKTLKNAFAWIAAGLFAAGCWALGELLRIQTDNGLAGAAQLRLSQWLIRLPLALTLLCMMLAAAFMPRLLRKLLDNRLARFFANLSFNLYIWHQVISVQIARNFYPNSLHSDPALQRGFMLFCYTASIVAAMAATYGIEKPAARLLEKARLYRLNHYDHKETIDHEGPKDADTVPPADPLLMRDESGPARTD